MYWSSWDRATSRIVINDANLDVVEDEEERLIEDGHHVTFWWVIARKPPPPLTSALEVTPTHLHVGFETIIGLARQLAN
jgi:hypothetical protein